MLGLALVMAGMVSTALALVDLIPNGMYIQLGMLMLGCMSIGVGVHYVWSYTDVHVDRTTPW